jgi:SsrA-binding protein
LKSSIKITNKKASYEYAFLMQFKAGLVLTGTEVKSLRNGSANLTDAFCTVINDEVWIKNLHISEYKEGSYENHELKRQRKLLLQKTEIKKINSKLKEKGITLIPLDIHFNERGFAKVTIAVARGKKLFDKRETLKEKDIKRAMARGSE